MPAKSTTATHLGECKSHRSPPPTDPSATSELWHAVKTSIALAQRQHRMPQRRKGGKAPSTPAAYATPPATTSDSVDPAESASQAARSTVTLRSRDFEEAVLTPRGIRVLRSTRPVIQRAHKHFGTGTAPFSSNQIPDGLQGARMWVSADDAKEIAEEYKALAQELYNEDEFAQLALEKLLHNESRADKERGERKPRAERLLKPICKPSANGLWDVPPILDPEAKHAVRYNWDVRADAAYYIQKRSFSQEYMPFMKAAVHTIRHSTVTCPYLTVEFKRSHEDELQAQRQALAAGSMALYNRYCLHERARTEHLEQASALSHVRHYTMTACGHTITIYVIWPVVRQRDEARTGGAAEKWSGCNMELLMTLDMREQAEAKWAIEWINAIHCWGVTHHLRSCENDVKILLQETMDVETSELINLNLK